MGCSFGADQVEGALGHLELRDLAYVPISRAPLPEIEAFKKRMGWGFRWVSSFGSDFNYDYQVSFTQDEIAKGEVYYNYEMRKFQSEELHGTSVFYRDEGGDIFHAYSRYARGGDLGSGAYGLLDITPKGRHETGPNHNLTDWVRHHDKYPQRAGGDDPERPVVQGLRLRSPLAAGRFGRANFVSIRCRCEIAPDGVGPALS